jgi:hypothetical protein
MNSPFSADLSNLFAKLTPEPTAIRLWLVDSAGRHGIVDCAGSTEANLPISIIWNK